MSEGVFIVEKNNALSSLSVIGMEINVLSTKEKANGGVLFNFRSVTQSPPTADEQENTTPA